MRAILAIYRRPIPLARAGRGKCGIFKGPPEEPSQRAAPGLGAGCVGRWSEARTFGFFPAAVRPRAKKVL